MLRRRRHKVAFVAVLLLVCWHGWIFGIRHLTRQEGQTRRDALLADLNAHDPDWTYAAINDQMPVIPDAENGSVYVKTFRAIQSKPYFSLTRSGASFSFEGPPNRQLDQHDTAKLNAELAAFDLELWHAYSFKNYPRAGHRHELSMKRVERWSDDAREAVKMLSTDAERYCINEQPGAALQLVRPMFYLGRTAQGTPSIIGCLDHIGCVRITIRTIERILAQGQPAPSSLRSLQELLADEMTIDHYWSYLRHERAWFHELHLALARKQVLVSEAPGLFGPSGLDINFWTPLVEWRYEPNLPGEHAHCLQAFKKALAVRQLPEEQQRVAISKMTIPPPEPGTVLINLSHGGLFSGVVFPRWHLAHYRCLASLRCAYVAVAVERFRCQEGRWPKTLAELTPAYLPTLPNDPFTGKALKYAEHNDGVTVYSVDDDGQDDGGLDPKKDTIFRLYHPEQRRLPPLPRSPDDRNTPKPDDEGLPFPRIVEPLAR